MAEQRYQAVMAVIGDGLTVSQAAEKTGVARQTLHRWHGSYARSLAAHRDRCGPCATWDGSYRGRARCQPGREDHLLLT